MIQGGEGLQEARSRQCLRGVAATMVLLLIASSATADPEPVSKDGETPSAEVIREAERIRRELGGSAIERFELLRDPKQPGSAARSPEAGGAPPRRNWGMRPPQIQRQIAILRRAAQELDLAANQVEELEAYAEADQIRTTAQRLRQMARRLAGSGSPGVAPYKPVAPISPAEPPGSAVVPEPD